MENALVTGQMAVRDMVELCVNYTFAPDLATANAIFVRKTIAAEALRLSVENALEPVGGEGLFRSMGLERLVRDMHLCSFIRSRRSGSIASPGESRLSRSGRLGPGHGHGILSTIVAEDTFETAADAVIEGRLTELQTLLRDQPLLATARSRREHHATLLHYVAANGVEQYRRSRHPPRWRSRTRCSKPGRR